MFKLVVHRYGKTEVFEYSSLKDALSMKEYIEDFGEGFIEFILDENDIVLGHGFENVVGVELTKSPVGKRYDLDKNKLVMEGESQ